MLVMTALLMWMPVCGPFPELQHELGGQDGLPVRPVVRAHGARRLADVRRRRRLHGLRPPVRVCGLSVTDDQQLAGVIMKIGGSVYLWTLCTILFFNRFVKNWDEENAYRPAPDPRCRDRRPRRRSRSPTTR